MVSRRKQLHGQTRRALQAREQARPREVRTKAEVKPAKVWPEPPPEPPKDLEYQEPTDAGPATGEV